MVRQRAGGLIHQPASSRADPPPAGGRSPVSDRRAGRSLPAAGWPRWAPSARRPEPRCRAPGRPTTSRRRRPRGRVAGAVRRHRPRRPRPVRARRERHRLPVHQPGQPDREQHPGQPPAGRSPRSARSATPCPLCRPWAVPGFTWAPDVHRFGDHYVLYFTVDRRRHRSGRRVHRHRLRPVAARAVHRRTAAVRLPARPARVDRPADVHRRRRDDLPDLEVRRQRRRERHRADEHLLPAAQPRRPAPRRPADPHLRARRALAGPDRRGPRSRLGPGGVLALLLRCLVQPAGLRHRRRPLRRPARAVRRLVHPTVPGARTTRAPVPASRPCSATPPASGCSTPRGGRTSPASQPRPGRWPCFASASVRPARTSLLPPPRSPRRRPVRRRRHSNRPSCRSPCRSAAPAGRRGPAERHGPAKRRGPAERRRPAGQLRAG